MTEVIADKWKIFFKQPTDRPLNESYIELVFRLKSDQMGLKSISKEDLQELENDIKDLGKWKQFKKLKNDLEK
ncbi:MAG: hypothetical protein AABX85_03375 [Nanoarchaeota archaeon]